MSSSKLNYNDAQIVDFVTDWGFTQKKSSLIVGPFYTQVGGVSIHILRLVALLSKTSFSYSIFDSSKTAFSGANLVALLSKILRKRYDQVHIHSISFQLMIAILIAKLFVRFDLFFSVHNPVLLQNKGFLFNKLRNTLLRYSYQINAVSEVVKSSIISELPVLENKIFVKSSFLPPDLSTKAHVKNTYPNSLIDFQKKHKPLLIINAYRLHFKNNIDVYGLDLSIELLIRLSKEYPNTGLILAIGKKDYSGYLESQIEKLREHEINSNFFLLEGFNDIWALFEDCDIMLRPTLYDGFGISVSEAILMGTKVIASNSTERQPECILFENRNIEDFEKVSLKLLKELGY